MIVKRKEGSDAALVYVQSRVQPIIEWWDKYKKQLLTETAKEQDEMHQKQETELEEAKEQFKRWMELYTALTDKYPQWTALISSMPMEHVYLIQQLDTEGSLYLAKEHTEVYNRVRELSYDWRWIGKAYIASAEMLSRWQELQGPMRVPEDYIPTPVIFLDTEIKDPVRDWNSLHYYLQDQVLPILEVERPEMTTGERIKLAADIKKLAKELGYQ